MSVNFSPPPAIRGDDRSSLTQMHSFLFRLTEQLNAALNEADRRIELAQTTATNAAMNVGGNTIINNIEGGGGSEDGDFTEQYNELKALIIKTAEDVRAEMDVIETKLQSDYIAKSEWGEYTESIEATIEQTAQGVVESYEYDAQLESLKDQAVDFESYKVETNGFIKRGIIGYDGEIPIIGIAIGKDLVSTTVTIDGVEQQEIDMSQSMATYTDDRVTFWQHGVEIAWFSSSELVCIGIRAEKIILGDDQWEVSQTPADGFMIKWIGGED